MAQQEQLGQRVEQGLLEVLYPLVADRQGSLRVKGRPAAEGVLDSPEVGKVEMVEMVGAEAAEAEAEAPVDLS